MSERPILNPLGERKIRVLQTKKVKDFFYHEFDQTQ